MTDRFRCHYWYSYARKYPRSCCHVHRILIVPFPSLQNAFVGWYQEKAAGDVVAKLKADIALKATVIRQGQEEVVEARDLVPGDIVVIEVRHGSC